jgi:three-Cys-motif partner protein
MATDRDTWGPWSERKLEILRNYLRAFTTASRGKSSEALYLDLFAGSWLNRRRDAEGTFPGSSQIAMTTRPAFTKLAFFELPAKAERLRDTLRTEAPGDHRWSVFGGDCNLEIEGALTNLEKWRVMPSFAFIDPRGLQVDWATIERLAAWKADRAWKVELWILFPGPAPARVVGLGNEGSAEAIDRVFGSRDWRAIARNKSLGRLAPRAERASYVNLYRWRLENELGYAKTHSLELTTRRGTPVYTMVFATDHPAGGRIMSHVYNATDVRALTSKDPGPIQEDLFGANAAPVQRHRHEPPSRPHVSPLDLRFDPPDEVLPLFDPDGWKGETAPEIEA